MRNSKVNILCTAPADDVFTGFDGIHVDFIPFIGVRWRTPEEIGNITRPYLKFPYWIFTSGNAVKAVAENVPDKPAAKIYCVGEQTSKSIQRYFGANSIEGVAGSAAELATRIISDGQTGELIFFCGKDRRNELPHILAKSGIKVKEVIVYETVTLNHKVDKRYDGILFFSPSGVKSFFKQNNINQSTILFGIGETTISELKVYSINQIIKAEQTSKNTLLEQAVNYFRVKIAAS